MAVIILHTATHLSIEAANTDHCEPPIGVFQFSEILPETSLYARHVVCVLVCSCIYLQQQQDFAQWKHKTCPVFKTKSNYHFNFGQFNDCITQRCGLLTLVAYSLHCCPVSKDILFDTKFKKCKQRSLCSHTYARLIFDSFSIVCLVLKTVNAISWVAVFIVGVSAEAS